ncbi:PhoX family protein [Phenylobacterium sp. LH3H17]|uniref:alkaline phosphatase PhoX n=1 Tax=Phenylobacterium sp. LH3H17 TaxID=2903901 RepID=UPI0020C9BD30|nr:alkaline phosphatase PhoX [Phenylobacterium sp. LH3H17]UTP37813.1 PhoX family protein [Phenylobacterium sp. LH3H17]
MSASRRQFLQAAAATAAFAGLSRLAYAQAAPEADGFSAPGYASEVTGYGPLKRDPARLIDLPEGFSYKVISKTGDPMDDGFMTPGKMDGMGCFPAGRNKVALVRNHEISPPPRDLQITAYGADRALASKLAAGRFYDTDLKGLPLGGGTTTLVYDMKKRELKTHHLSLAGTTTNCAGGVTPWGSWLTCEEVKLRAGESSKLDHGWVFEVPSRLRGLADPVPIKAMGRFKHEACAVDPRTGVIYMTEDETDGQGLFYRYLPKDSRNPHEGGKLQALAVTDGGDVRNWDDVFWKPGDWKTVRWIDLDGVDNPNNDLRQRGKAAGASWFARGEGIHFGKGELYFTCTSGGPKFHGQVLRYVPSPDEGRPGETDRPGRLQLFVEPSDIRFMEMADNIVIAPWGHIIACEDKQGGTNYLRGITPAGQVYAMGRNAQMGTGKVRGASELAGACFSPDGSTLFVNIYTPGCTLAITGPWDSFKA